MVKKHNTSLYVVVEIYVYLVGDWRPLVQVKYVAGGATQNSIRVAQWMLQDGTTEDGFCQG